MPRPPQNLRDFKALVSVVEALRGPDGCPWDKEQTHQSLTPYAIEEVHEFVAAVESANWPEVVEELGDVLLQVVLHAEIGRQEGRFDIQDVIEGIASKMVRRHPHVFGDVKVENSSQVLENWGQIKEREKAQKPADRFALPSGLPALMVSHKIGSKTRKLNFDWQTPEQVLEKVEEELAELKAALKSGKRDEQEHEIGDLLFSVSQLARHLNLDAEKSLRLTNERFKRRFAKMEDLCSAQGRAITDLKPEELEELWQKAKALETQQF